MTAEDAIGLALGAGWAMAVVMRATADVRRRGMRRPLPPGVAPVARAADGVWPDPARDDRPAWPPARRSGADAGGAAAPAPPVVAPPPDRRSPVMALGAAIRRFAGVTASPPVGATAQGARSPGTPQARAPRASAPWVGTPAGVPQAGALAAGTPPGAARASAPARAPAIRRGGDAEAADRRTGWAALAGGALLLVAPALAAVPLAWTVAAPVLTVRRDRARHDAQLHDQLPDVVDLLALTTAAGLPVAAALVAISDRPGGSLGRALARAGAHVRHGGSTGEALALLADAGPPARPLVDALVQHERYGTPLLPALERVGIEARSRRRRRAEETARRLPVTLLFPLVLTTFPAFVLLTVVPLLAGSLGSLSLSPT